METAKKREQTRVAVLLARDKADARAKRLRDIAEQEIEEGKFANIDDTIVGPTPEQLRSGEFVPHRPDKTEGTVRSLETVKRVQVNRIVQLHQRGVLDDDTFPACLWYSRTWEACGFTLAASAAAWGEQIPGDRVYGLGPKTPAQVEARHNFRHARAFIPADMVATFDLVVLEELTIVEAARAARCRFTNVTAVVRHSALKLLGGIAHLLPVRAVGAMGDGPAVPPVEDGQEDTTWFAKLLSGEGAAIDPDFLDERGLMRPWDEISEIIRGRLADEGEG